MSFWYKPMVDLITHLRSFVAVADAGSFTVGAAHILVQQPVVSRRVLALERSLGRDLFVRSAHRLELTDVGRKLLPYAKDLVARADRFAGLAAQRDGVLRVGIRADIDLTPLAPAAKLAQDAGLELEVVEVPRGLRRAQVDSGELHIALVDADPDVSDVVVPLGAGSADDSRDGGRTRVFHFDELRRSRMRPRASLRRILLCQEDDVPAIHNRVRQRMVGAGLSPDQFEVSGSVADVITRVHAHGDLVLCPPPFADKHGLTWRPLGDGGLDRCYAIRTNPCPPDVDHASVLEVIIPALRHALGGRGR